MRERFIKSIAVLTTILLSLLVCYALYGQINQFINPYPAEYRNGAHAYMAKQISEGVNPYSLENVTYSNAYVYGPVMPYIAGGGYEHNRLVGADMPENSGFFMFAGISCFNRALNFSL